MEGHVSSRASLKSCSALASLTAGVDESGRGHFILFQQIFAATILVLAFPTFAFAQELQREQWGAPEVTARRTADEWVITGKKNRFTISESDLGIKVQAAD